MRKFFWISIRRLRSHELRTTLRILHPGHTNWRHRYQILGELQNENIVSLTKFFAATLPLVLALRSFGNVPEIGFSLGTVAVSVPTGMFSFTASLLFFLSILSFQNLIVIMSTKIRMGIEVKAHGFSVNAFDFMSGHSDLALSIPNTLNFFFKDSLRVSKLLSFFLMLAFLLFLWPVVILMLFLVSHQLDQINAIGISLTDKLSALGGLTVIGISFVYFSLFNLPLPLSRNLHFIRFGFLARISGTQLHPRAATWLGKR